MLSTSQSRVKSSLVVLPLLLQVDVSVVALLSTVWFRWCSTNPPSLPGALVMVYSRTSASDFDDWANVYGNKGWDSKSLIPLLRKVWIVFALRDLAWSSAGWDLPSRLSERYPRKIWTSQSLFRQVGVQCCRWISRCCGTIRLAARTYWWSQRTSRSQWLWSE